MISSLNFEECLDVLLLTEMWHTNQDDVTLRRCVPPVYAYVDVTRPSDGSRQYQLPRKRRPDVADRRFTCRIHASLRTYTESFCFSVIEGGWSVVNLVIPYRPGSVPISDAFFTELTTCLELLALYNCQCQTVVSGDVNIYAERSHDPATA